MASPMNQLWPTNSTTRANTGLTIRNGDASISDPLSSTATHNNVSLDRRIPVAIQDDTNKSNGTWPRKSMPSIHVRSASIPHDEPDAQNRMSLGPSIVMSSLSSAPSKISLFQPRQGGFRATLKRMFGSKRGCVPITDSANQYFRNPSEVLTLPMNFSYEQSQLGRPVTKSSALGSHAVQISPSNDTSTMSDVKRNAQPYFKRRNTLPSLVFSDAEAQSIAKSLSGFEDTHALQQQQDMSQPHLSADKRRSRSAEALSKQNYAKEFTSSHTRDRSSTITYWRNSVTTNPSAKAMDSPVRDTFSNLPKPDPTNTTRLPHESPLKPAQSFDFGLGSADEPVDLEERVNTLEVKMFDFEYAIAKLQGAELAKPVLPLRTTRKKSVPHLFSSTAGSSYSLSDSTFTPPPSSTSIQISRQTSRQVADYQNTSHSTHDNHTPTIRPNTSHGAFSRSSAPSPTSVRLTHEQFEKLMTMIQDEKQARQQIEMQVIDLQKEVELLQAPVYATIRPLDFSASSFSTSGHDQTDDPSGIPKRAKTLHRTAPFEFKKTPMSHHDASRFSMTESNAGSTMSDDTYDEELYQTPQENNFRFESSHGSPLIAA